MGALLPNLTLFETYVLHLQNVGLQEFLRLRRRPDGRLDARRKCHGVFHHGVPRLHKHSECDSCNLSARQIVRQRDSSLDA